MKLLVTALLMGLMIMLFISPREVVARQLESSFAMATNYYSDQELRLRFLDRIRETVPAGVELRVERFFVRGAVARTARRHWVEPQPPIGIVQFEYRWDEEGATKRVLGNAEVSAMAKVGIARAPIRHGEVFNSQNVMFEERPVTAHVRTGYFQNLDSLKGLRANGFIRPGLILNSRNTQQPYLVEMGQTVELIRESANLKIVVQVKALQRGRELDWVRVRNPSTNRVFQAQVVGSGKVQMP